MGQCKFRFDPSGDSQMVIPVATNFEAAQTWRNPDGRELGAVPLQWVLLGKIGDENLLRQLASAGDHVDRLPEEVVKGSLSDDDGLPDQQEWLKRRLHPQRSGIW